MEITAIGKIENTGRRMHRAVSILFGRAGKNAYDRNMAFCKFQFILVYNFNYVAQR